MMWSLNPGKGQYFLLFCNIQLGAGSHPASCLMGTVVLSKGKSVWDVILSRHFSLQPRWNYIFASDRDKYSSSSSNGSCRSFCSHSIVTQKKIAQNSRSLLC